MTRSEAKKLAETVTPAELKAMLIDARNNITDWTRRSRVNIGMTIGTTFNIFSVGFEIESPLPQNMHILAKTNMIWEFGEYLPKYVKPTSKERKLDIRVVHQEPRKL
jgi:hypothetical protein